MRARPEDYDSIIEIAEECFPKDRDSGGMLPRWPHCFRKDKIQNSLIIKDGDRIVSHVGCIDQTVMLGKKDVRVAGISTVSTLPNYRGRGLMTKLLQYLIPFVQKEGYALSDLGGDRVRYGRFEWEPAGRMWQYTVTPRSLGAKKKPVGVEISRYTGKPKEVDLTLQLQTSQLVGLKRDPELHRMLLGRHGKEVYVAWKKSSLDSYAVVDRQEKHCRIEEFGGTPEGLHAMFGDLVDSGIESTSMAVPWAHPLNGKLREISSGWSLGCLRMMKIINLYATLKAFSEQLSSRYQEIGFKGNRNVALGLDGTATQVELDFSEDGVSVTQIEAQRGTIVLPERKMVQMLFGPGPPETVTPLPRQTEFLGALLPVDFFIWYNEMV